MTEQPWPPGQIEYTCPECGHEGLHSVTDDAGRTLLVECGTCGKEFEVTT